MVAVGLPPASGPAPWGVCCPSEALTSAPPWAQSLLLWGELTRVISCRSVPGTLHWLIPLTHGNPRGQRPTGSTAWSIESASKTRIRPQRPSSHDDPTPCAPFLVVAAATASPCGLPQPPTRVSTPPWHSTFPSRPAFAASEFQSLPVSSQDRAQTSVSCRDLCRTGTHVPGRLSQEPKTPAGAWETRVRSSGPVPGARIIGL